MPKLSKKAIFINVVRQLRYASSAATYKELTGTSNVNNHFVIPRIWQKCETQTVGSKNQAYEEAKLGENQDRSHEKVT
jgi:hypothetical protein